MLIGSVNIFDMAIFKFEMAVLAREGKMAARARERCGERPFWKS